MLTLEFYNKQKHYSDLLYDLDEVQASFTSTFAHALERTKNAPEDTAFIITVLKNDSPSGFFVLDFGEDKWELSENPNCVLFRSFSINPKFQGQGLGKEAVLKTEDFLQKHFPECDEIVLAVNEKNIPAKQLYLKCGYKDEGKTRVGAKGRQFILNKKLK